MPVLFNSFWMLYVTVLWHVFEHASLGLSFWLSNVPIWTLGTVMPNLLESTRLDTIPGPKATCVTCKTQPEPVDFSVCFHSKWTSKWMGPPANSCEETNRSRGSRTPTLRASLATARWRIGRTSWTSALHVESDFWPDRFTQKEKLRSSHVAWRSGLTFRWTMWTIIHLFFKLFIIRDSFGPTKTVDSNCPSIGNCPADLQHIPQTLQWAPGYPPRAVQRTAVESACRTPMAPVPQQWPQTLEPTYPTAPDLQKLWNSWTWKLSTQLSKPKDHAAPPWCWGDFTQERHGPRLLDHGLGIRNHQIPSSFNVRNLADVFRKPAYCLVCPNCNIYTYKILQGLCTIHDQTHISSDAFSCQKRAYGFRAKAPISSKVMPPMKA